MISMSTFFCFCTICLKSWAVAMAGNWIEANSLPQWSRLARATQETLTAQKDLEQPHVAQPAPRLLPCCPGASWTCQEPPAAPRSQSPGAWGFMRLTQSKRYKRSSSYGNQGERSAALSACNAHESRTPSASSAWPACRHSVGRDTHT
jgi:hypothetical protein